PAPRPRDDGGSAPRGTGEAGGRGGPRRARPGPSPPGGGPPGTRRGGAGGRVASGHNERVQRGDPIAPGEISCLRNAGRQPSYQDMTLYTTLSPCQMCSGAILLFQIPRVVVGEATTFAGDLDFLASQGVDVLLLDDDRCKAVMQEFQERYPQVWSEDIGGR